MHAGPHPHGPPLGLYGPPPPHPHFYGPPHPAPIYPGYDYYRGPAPGARPPHGFGPPPPHYGSGPTPWAPPPHGALAPHPHAVRDTHHGGAHVEAGRVRDFAEEKPEVYRAFERMAVQSTELGVQISLPDQMCMDRHVPDFVQCLECWLKRCLGEPRVTNRVWRLRRLDLSRNDLSDSCLCSVIALLKRLDVRVECLWIAGNRLEAHGLSVITDYVWNCPEALHELDLADNNVFADPGGGSSGVEQGADVVSGLLRCIYNHSGYPRTLVDAYGPDAKVMPLLLRLGGNQILHPKRLLREIQSKGGKNHVRVCSEMAAYKPNDQEFLSIFAPDFNSQRKKDEKVGGPGAAAAPAPMSAVPGAKEAAGTAPRHTPEERQGQEAAGRSRSRKHDKSRKKRRLAAAGASLDQAAIEASQTHNNGGAPNGPPDKDSPGALEATNAAPPVAAAGLDAENVGGSPGWPLPAEFSGALQLEFQDEVHERLLSIKGLPCENEESMRTMLAEFTVCMIVAKKPQEAIEGELQTFLGQEARTLIEWLSERLQARFGGSERKRVLERPPCADDAFQ